jgi:hypothetical protein
MSALVIMRMSECVSQVVKAQRPQIGPIPTSGLALGPLHDEGHS